MTATVTDIVTAVETVKVEAAPAKASPKKRDLKKIGRNLARQVTKAGVTEMSIEAIMAAKLVDRVQAKAVVAHATAVLTERGKPVPAFV